MAVRRQPWAHPVLKSRASLVFVSAQTTSIQLLTRRSVSTVSKHLKAPHSAQLPQP